MKSLVTIRSEWEAAQQAYDRVAHMARAEWEPAHKKAVALRDELRAAIARGAVPCSRCGQQPVGLRHIRAQLARQNTSVFWHVFEIGCINCFDPDEDDRRGFANTPKRYDGKELDQFADETAARAVQEWNRLNGG